LIPSHFLGIEGFGFEITFHFIAVVGWSFCRKEFLSQAQALGYRFGFAVIELQMYEFSSWNKELIVVLPILFQNDPGLFRETTYRCLLGNGGGSSNVLQSRWISVI